jgi:hypothetical protein
MKVRRPPQKSASATTAFVTLHRPPPLTRIFAPGRFAPSSSATDTVCERRLAKMAVARPAAPAPTIATSEMCKRWPSGDAKVVRPTSLPRRLQRMDGGCAERDVRAVAARGTADEHELQVVADPDDFRAMAPAFRAERRRTLSSEARGIVVDHSVLRGHQDARQCAASTQRLATERVAIRFRKRSLDKVCWSGTPSRRFGRLEGG